MKLTVVIQVFAEGDKLIVDRIEVDTERDHAIVDVAHALRKALEQWDRDQKTMQDSQG